MSAPRLGGRPPLSYREHIPRNLDAVYKQSAEGLKEVADIKHLIKQIVQVEANYAKALLKTCTAANVKKYVMNEDNLSSIRPSYAVVNAEFHSLGKAHYDFAVFLANDVARIMSQWIRAREKARKGMIEAVQRVQKEYGDCMRAMALAKRIYYTCVRDRDSADAAVAAIKEAVLINQAKLAKAESKLARAQEEVERTRAEYRTAVATADTQQSAYFDTELPALLERFQTFEESRVQFVQKMLQRVCDYCQKFPHEHDVMYRKVSAAVGTISIAGDVQYFIARTRDAPDTDDGPQPIQYDEYEEAAAAEFLKAVSGPYRPLADVALKSKMKWNQRRTSSMQKLSRQDSSTADDSGGGSGSGVYGSSPTASPVPGGARTGSGTRSGGMFGFMSGASSSAAGGGDDLNLSDDGEDDDKDLDKMLYGRIPKELRNVEPPTPSRDTSRGSEFSAGASGAGVNFEALSRETGEAGFIDAPPRMAASAGSVTAARAYASSSPSALAPAAATTGPHSNVSIPRRGGRTGAASPAYGASPAPLTAGGGGGSGRPSPAVPPRRANPLTASSGGSGIAGVQVDGTYHNFTIPNRSQSGRGSAPRMTDTGTGASSHVVPAVGGGASGPGTPTRPARRNVSPAAPATDGGGEYHGSAERW